MVQGGDPTGTGRGGESIYGLVSGYQMPTMLDVTLKFKLFKNILFGET